MPRIETELVLASPYATNACGELELDLRSNHIPAIENLGILRDQFDSLDMSNNDIQALEGLARMQRLTTLVLNNNRISRVQGGVGKNTPMVETVVLTGNLLSSLDDLKPLASFKKLRNLSLLDNPVRQQRNYRLFVIAHVPQLKILDFQKIHWKERKAARRLYGTPTEDGEAAAAAAAVAEFDPDQDLDRALKERAEAKPGGLLTADERALLLSELEKATSIDVINALESALETGRMPAYLLDGGADEEENEDEDGATATT